MADKASHEELYDVELTYRLRPHCKGQLLPPIRFTMDQQDLPIDGAATVNQVITEAIARLTELGVAVAAGCVPAERLNANPILAPMAQKHAHKKG